jgi:hypothetical protein
MKLKTKILALPLLGLITALVGVTCVNQDIQTLGTEAELTALSLQSALDVNGVNTIITDTVSKVALPIPASIMEKEDLSAADLYGSDYDQPDTTIGWADIKVRDKETGKITGRIRPTVSKGARAQWGIGTRSTRPDAFYDTRVPATLDNDEYIYIRVSSEDGEIVNYYRFYAKLLSWTTNLQYIRVGNREGKAGATVEGKSAGGSSWDKALGLQVGVDANKKPIYEELTFSIALKEGNKAVVEAVLFDPNSMAKYAVVADNKTEPTKFTPSDQPIDIIDQNYLYVEVTAENTLDKEYFRFKVSVGRITTIASFKVGDSATDTANDIEVYGLGLPQKSWGNVGFGKYETADQPTEGFFIKLVMDDPDAAFEWEKISNNFTPEPGKYNSTARIRFTNPEALAIKIKAPNDPNPMFYKVSITNLAANIKQHPKTAWYYRDDIKADGVSEEGKRPVEPLTVVLDRPAKGTYEYQWYEADSWYGIYGRHGTSIDEKNNLTTVNGGPGQYFYLVQPDEPPITLEPTGYDATDWGKSPGAWKGGPDPNAYYWADYSRGGEPMAWSVPDAEGGKTPSIRPRTDWIDDSKNMTFHGTATQNNSFPVKPVPPRVNFFSGSTNESRYYWVKVTDTGTGLSVTSERALILTETDPNMDHFIFDLSSLPKKNIVPFTKNGTAEDNVYKIPLPANYFPADFEEKVKDYQICIAHAQYFLVDGRPWTQNWTHGNLHIGTNKGYADLEWWHNNMGANGGSIPLQAPHSSKGGLTVKPDWIGFTPSGDPAKGLPPPINAAGDLPKGIYSMNATDKYPAGVAQGYFAAFIELLEIRFQTAPQN